jgi:dephospho-CoA kinase
VKLAGLGGGIGCGKSSVAAHFAARGAHVIELDAMTRESQQPGQPIFVAMVARWGERILAPSGELDRQALADLVFGDPGELQALRAITDTPMFNEINRRIAAHFGTDDVVVFEAAQLLGKDRRGYGMKGVIIVDVPVEIAMQRLVQHRGMPEADARRRMEQQMPREERLQYADFVLDNSGTADELHERVDAAWDWLLALPDADEDAVPERA